MFTRMTRWSLLLLVGSALIAGCGLAGRTQAPQGEPSPRTQRQDPLIEAELRSLRAEQKQLQEQNETLRGQLAELKQGQQAAHADRRQFQDTMTTNFQLLEKSVAMTLSSLVRPEPTATPAAKPAGRKPVAAMKAMKREEPAKPAAQPVATAKANPAPAAALPVVAVRASTSRPATRPALLTPPEPEALDDADLRGAAQPRTLSPHPEAKALYEKGFSLFARQNYAHAIAVYGDFLVRFPDDIYSDNAQFWVGEAHFQQKRYGDAEAAFREVLRNYAHRSTLEGYKTPDAIYRIGQTYLKRNDTRRAGFYFANVAARFPDTSAGRKARRELDTLKLNMVEATAPGSGTGS